MYKAGRQAEQSKTPKDRQGVVGNQAYKRGGRANSRSKPSRRGRKEEGVFLGNPVSFVETWSGRRAGERRGALMLVWQWPFLNVLCDPKECPRWFPRKSSDRREAMKLALVRRPSCFLAAERRSGDRCGV
jgi:hypothetical protein